MGKFIPAQRIVTVSMGSAKLARKDYAVEAEDCDVVQSVDFVSVEKRILALRNTTARGAEPTRVLKVDTAKTASHTDVPMGCCAPTAGSTLVQKGAFASKDKPADARKASVVVRVEELDVPMEGYVPTERSIPAPIESIVGEEKPALVPQVTIVNKGKSAPANDCPSVTFVMAKGNVGSALSFGSAEEANVMFG